MNITVDESMKITEGYLAKYASMATAVDTGAILKW
jgi:hypothetical protein